MIKDLRIKQIEKKMVSKDDTETTVFKATLENENGDKVTIEQSEPFMGWKPNNYIRLSAVNDQKTVSEFDKALGNLKEPKTPADIDHNVEVAKKSVEKKKDPVKEALKKVTVKPRKK